jgi:hypothetical protein
MKKLIIISLLLLLFYSNSWAAIVKGTNSGFVTSSPSGDPGGGSSVVSDNAAIAIKDTTPAGAVSVTEAGWFKHSGVTNSNFEMGIYSHDAVNDEPNALLAGADQTTTSVNNSWNVATGINTTVSGSTTYWIAMQLDDTVNSQSMDRNTEAAARFSRYTGVSTLADPWPDSATEATSAIHAMYAKVNIQIRRIMIMQ